ncbi:MAG: PDZ domain-containing protein, partial [Lachnospiraceae bacterium]|nr:PDZ domain-containing protein [Lachnospiraceae bacterium]
MEYLHKIESIDAGSIAEELDIEPGDVLVSVNGKKVEDIFDYRYLCNDEKLLVVIRKPNGEEWELEIEKDPDEDLGIGFGGGLMSEYRSCRNHCIFCFVNQMPKGMRDTLYFHDDDARLSFLQGNYITMTNMSDHDIDRIILYHLEPINISFHTMNPELRRKMLHNRFAGDIMPKVMRLKNAGIRLNGQIVLCKGWNDGEDLEHSLKTFEQLLPELESVSVVPVGMTKFREENHQVQLEP